MTFPSDPRRDLVWRELHARPYVRFSAPAHLWHFAFSIEASDAGGLAHPDRVTSRLGLVATHETPRHRIYAGDLSGLGRLVLSWERHSEYVAYTFFLYALEIPFQPFVLDFRRILPGWPEDLPSPPLVATRIAIGSRREMPATLEGLTELFEGHTVNGSQVMAGRAEAWSCYRIHTDGFGRIAVVVDQMSPQDLGRTAERLLAIEDFSHLTLLSQPLIEEVKPSVSSAEGRMVEEMDALRGADSIEQKRSVLDALLELAVEVEHLRARVSNRFEASSAYFFLLESRFAELREGKIEHVLRLSRFVMRRLAPAARTCRGILDRLSNLSERVDRAADLLRTAIELHVEEQNQRLLESADRRSRLQLRLQEAVEGLSVVVITYYVLALLAYPLRSADRLGVHLDPDATLSVALPFVLLAVWFVAHRVRKGFRDRP